MVSEEEVNRNLKAARAYLDRGLSVFPLNDKVPISENGVKDAANSLSTDLTAVFNKGQSNETRVTRSLEEWLTRAGSNIAIAVPPGVVVIDIDPRNGGTKTFGDWCASYGWPEAVPEAATGGDGTHFWFKYDGGKLIKTIGGVDFLRVGKYVVAPPSTTDKPYAWKVPLPANLDNLPELPGWLRVIATPEEREFVGTSNTFESSGIDELREAAHKYTTWEALLASHGWKQVGPEKWRRPGSEHPVSATIKYDCLFVYSTNTPFPVTDSDETNGITLYNGILKLDFDDDQESMLRTFRERGLLRSGQNYDILDVLVDRLKAERAEPVEPDSATDENEETEDRPSSALGARIDWPTFWLQDDHFEDRWLSEPFLGKGRAHAVYASAKTGKSLFLLQGAAALATGRAFLDKPAHDPVPVIYCDYEMTEEDVRQRLTQFGYGPETDLSHLHYYLLGSGQPLDTVGGGTALIETAAEARTQLVVIDTTARAVEGGENDADTLRAFYRCSGVGLKRLGIAWVRVDHSGKDVLKGQRGSSAKNDDVDVVFRLSAKNANTFVLEATHQRMGWVPKTTDLELVNTNNGERLDWRRHGGRVYSKGVKELADELDKLTPRHDLKWREVEDLFGAARVPFNKSLTGEILAFRLERSFSGLNGILDDRS